MAKSADPATPSRDSSNLTLALTVGYVRARAGTDAVDRLLELAGEDRPLSVLEDETGWSTQEQKVRLFEAAAEVLDDPLASRHIGETVLDQRTGASLKLLLRTLGSPAALFKSVAKASAKFSTNYTCEALTVGRREAVIVNRLHEGYEPHALDCAYTAGLLSTVPSVFGLPLATVEHEECQVRGAPACVYRLRWRPRSRLPWRAAKARHTDQADQLRVVTDRYEALQSTLADLVSPADVDTVLSRITRRAADAVRAQQFLLALVGDDGTPTLHFDGMTGEEAARLAKVVLADDRPRLGPSVLIADVASARRAPTGGSSRSTAANTPSSPRKSGSSPPTPARRRSRSTAPRRSPRCPIGARRRSVCSTCRGRWRWHRRPRRWRSTWLRPFRP